MSADRRINILQRALKVSGSLERNLCSAEKDGFILCYGNHAMPFESWKVGQKLITKRRTINTADVINFAHMTGYDSENLFGDMVYLKEVAGHSRRLVPGMLSGSVADALIVGSGILEGYAVALVSLDNFRAIAPVYADDSIQVELEVVAVKPSKSKPNLGFVTTHQVVKNQDGKVVLEYDVTRMLRRSKS